MKSIHYSGKGVISTSVGHGLVKVVPGNNVMDNAMADAFMKNIKGSYLADLCTVSAAKADKKVAKKVAKNVAKKVASKKKTSKKKTKKK